MLNQRFSTISNVIKDNWVIGCPIEITKAALLLDNQNNNIILQLKLRNVSNKIIKYADLLVKRFDAEGNIIEGLEDPVAAYYYDLNVSIHNTFGDRIATNLGDNITRKVEIIFNKVIFNYGEIWLYESHSSKQTYPKREISSALSNPLLQQYNREYFLIQSTTQHFDQITDHEILPEQFIDGWLCTCGFSNVFDNTVCGRCGINKNKLFQIIDEEYLTEKLKEHLGKHEYDSKEAIYNEVIFRKSNSINESCLLPATELNNSLNEFNNSKVYADDCVKLEKTVNIAESKIKRKRIVAAVAMISIIAFSIIGLTINKHILSTRVLFDSEEEMISAISGNWSEIQLLGNEKYIESIITISDNKIIEFTNCDQEGVNISIRLNPSRGIIYIENSKYITTRKLGSLIMVRPGDVKKDSELEDYYMSGGNINILPSKDKEAEQSDVKNAAYQYMRIVEKNNESINNYDYFGDFMCFGNKWSAYIVIYFDGGVNRYGELKIIKNSEGEYEVQGIEFDD